MNCKILSKFIDRITIRGMMLFVKEDEDNGLSNNIAKTELYQQATLCYLTFYEHLDAQLLADEVDEVIESNINDFHQDYKESIDSLYQSLNIIYVTSIIQMVEEFIKETIRARHEQTIY